MKPIVNIGSGSISVVSPTEKEDLSIFSFNTEALAHPAQNCSPCPKLQLDRGRIRIKLGISHIDQ